MPPVPRSFKKHYKEQALIEFVQQLFETTQYHDIVKALNGLKVSAPA